MCCATSAARRGEPAGREHRRLARSAAAARPEAHAAVRQRRDAAPRRARAGRSARRSSAGCRSPPRRPERRSETSHSSASSSRSQTSRCSAGSPPGHSRAEVLEAAVPPDDARREQHRAAGARALLVARPAARRARSRARRRTARPCPRRATTRVARSGERERRLVLDVLDADAVGPASGRRRRCSAASTTDSTSIPSALGPAPVLLGRLDEQAEVVQQRPLGRLGRLAVHEDEPRAADLDRAQRRALQAVALEGRAPSRSGSGVENATWSRS